MKKIQTNYGLSQNVTQGIASMLRSSAKDRKVVEKGLKEKLRTDLHSVDQFFDVKLCNFVSNKNNETTTVQQPTIYCKDLPQFIQRKMNPFNPKRLEQCIKMV